MLPSPITPAPRRQSYLQEMRRAAPLYTSPKSLRLFTGTWNVNGRPPDLTVDLRPWLRPTPSPDLYLLAFQEVQPLTGVDAVRTDPAKGQLWADRVAAVLKDDYDRVAMRQMVGILVLVYVRRNHAPYLTNVQLSYAATGFLNALGNKGGVAARFQLYDRTLSCVACHLAAHVEFVDRRNQDFRDVVRKAVFLPVEPLDLDKPNPEPPLPSGPGQWLGTVASVAATAFSDISAGASTAVLNDPNALKILEHDVVFWLGDLNYRIEAPLNDVLEWVRTNNWRELYRADQLQREMKRCDAFHRFQEGPIRFPPTYKLQRFEDSYKIGDTEETTRIPSYTDRILWRVGDAARASKLRLKLAEYNSAKVYSSDHRPVYALFDMTFGVEDAQRRRKVEARINRDLDIREASQRPSLQLSSSAADFGDIFFEQKCVRSVAIRNTGRETAFVTVAVPTHLPNWLRFDPEAWQCVQVPPQKSVQVKFGVFVTARNGSANELSRNGCVFNARIEVRAEPGQVLEHFDIRGRYVSTTLGLSLETLSMLEHPVLALRQPKHHCDVGLGTLIEREGDYERGAEPGVVPRTIPKELWLLVDALFRPADGSEKRYIDTCADIFRKSGDEASTQRVLAFVDRGERIPHDLSGYAIASCLLEVLDNLEDSVIPRVLYKRALEAGHTEEIELINGVLEMLPPLNANVFWYIVGFLCESATIKEASDGGKEIAEIFAGVLLRTKDPLNSRDRRYKISFMLGAFQIQQRYRKPAYRAVFDLSNPATHPKRIVSSLAAGR